MAGSEIKPGLDIPAQGPWRPRFLQPLPGSASRVLMNVGVGGGGGGGGGILCSADLETSTSIKNQMWNGGVLPATSPCFSDALLGHFSGSQGLHRDLI